MTHSDPYASNGNTLTSTFRVATGQKVTLDKGNVTTHVVGNGSIDTNVFTKLLVASNDLVGLSHYFRHNSATYNVYTF